MRAKDFELPIVNRWNVVRDYPLEVVSTTFVHKWDASSTELAPYLRSVARRVLLLLECFAQITKQTPPTEIDAETFPSWDRLFEQLFGAICSTRFCSGKFGSRRCLALTLLKVRAVLAASLGMDLPWEIAVRMQPTPETQRLVKLFEELDLDADRVMVWQGWPCQRKSGGFTFAPLQPIYTRFGSEFTKNLYDLCKAYIGGRRKTALYAVTAFSRFVEECDFKITLEALSDPAQTSDFFFKFYEHFLRTLYDDGKGSSIARIVQMWRRDVTSFFHELVFPSGLIAKPNGVFPTPRNISTKREPTHIRDSDTGEFHDKLLTPVPLQFTDDQALQLLFFQIKADLSAAKEWAWSEVHRMAQLLKRRKDLAAEGGVRRIVRSQRQVEHPTDWNHPHHLRNGAATFEHYGYLSSQDNLRLSLLFPAPRGRWAVELALPSTGALLPHCAILVSEHPQITPSFLESLELYDKNGKLRGVIPTESGEIVLGSKLRRGPTLAAQEVSLNERSSFALDQIIKLTQPVRDFLKERHDDRWRYLLLTSGRAFAYPRRVLGLASLCSTPAGLERLAESAKRVLNLDKDASSKFSARFSISALRAQAGVVVYLETKSVDQMAKALGHASYDPMLLDRYLPKAIHDFFQERWVRIFQTGIIVQTMKKSRFLLRASSFDSMQQVDEFLRNHALRIPAQVESEVDRSTAHRRPSEEDLRVSKEVIFALDEEILTLMLSLAKVAERPMKPLAPQVLYWAALTNALIPYIESTANYRDDIRQHLAAARLRVSETLVESIAYA